MVFEALSVRFAPMPPCGHVRISCRAQKDARRGTARALSPLQGFGLGTIENPGFVPACGRAITLGYDAFAPVGLETAGRCGAARAF
jgi:hypothetical protein